MTVGGPLFLPSFTANILPYIDGNMTINLEHDVKSRSLIPSNQFGCYNPAIL